MIKSFWKNKKPKNKELHNLKKRAIYWFNRWIRRRDTDSQGVGRCCSCGRLLSFENMQAGHYINCRHEALRFEEKNVNGQCFQCNCMDEGNHSGYTKFMIGKYGPAELVILDLRKNNRCHRFPWEYDIIIKDYKERCKGYDRISID